ncbi:methyl-accepting chemotaxis protein [Tropicibacter naphthalenivorans]|uniref:Methyl-accepting chemotaxis protein 2 n=1 Tax=Tropicibacter naphthalenivorans TaxID=441103 RepID=A0A0P1GG90_9RHOB|nr:methyl-accepting chemotaxis protein [Tropicibacter naphthalenivorans]CUH80462.1 Methyl-accepting chemotaxis protein 2 [Tropicibacter naphthalenivorans]SMC86458.1 methyl-accepting chemotaxis protein [Tropicibacter naphthalenivorans]
MQENTNFDAPDASKELAELTESATGLGHEIVDIVGFLQDLDNRCKSQLTLLQGVQNNTAGLARASESTVAAVDRMVLAADDAIEQVRTSTSLIAESGQSSQSLAEWVRSVHSETEIVEKLLHAVRNSNALITDIASQVHILAINAKIEAARAGQAGKGFSIVADSVKDLSGKTTDAAETITETVAELSEWMSRLHRGAQETVTQAETVLTRSGQTDRALAEIEAGMSRLRDDAHALSQDAARSKEAMDHTGNAVDDIAESIAAVAKGVDEANKRCENLIDTSEGILQHAVALGGSGEDGAMITLVQDLAGQISMAFDAAVRSGHITIEQLFNQSYQPIAGSNPEQVLAPFTRLTDRLLPPIQEPVLDHDSRIVFCAAVDTNGYLPTHNKKFSHPQGPDPVWNAANCRNRRIFDDRVGLKAGQNEKPFLLQVYRRDMGGGVFAMMKDLSAPIHVQGRHWGGLRLAYKI